MDDINRSISQYVKTGKYYEDARIWYANRFIFPVSERTYIVILLSFFIASAAILGYFYTLVDPAPQQLSYMSSTPDIAKSYAVILPAGNFIEEPQVSINKYMLSTYVMNRETYEFGRIKEQLDFIRNTTVGKFFKY